MLKYIFQQPAGHRKRKVRLLCKGVIGCFILAALVLFPIWEYLVFSASGFFNLTPVRTDYAAALLLLVALSALFIGLFGLSRKLGCWWRNRISGCLLLIVLYIGPVKEIAFILDGKWSWMGHGFPRLVFNQFTVAGFLTAAIFNSWKTFRLFWRLVLTGTPVLVLILLMSVFGILNAKAPVEDSLIESPISASQGFPSLLANRVVWIIFDELDYRITFAEPPLRFSLPKFHFLADQAICFTNAFSPSRATITSVPSLIDGITYAAALPVSPARLTLRTGTGRTTQWGVESNAFSDCKGLGGRSAAIGWYFPYARIFHTTVDHIRWAPFETAEFVGESKSVGEAMRRQVLRILPILRKIVHRLTLENLQEDVSRSVADPNFSLCFVHLPVPHLPGVINSYSTTNLLKLVSNRRAYLSNLRLADDCLGRYLEAIAGSSVAGKTTLIVSSDHPWRTSQSYDGRSDPRVPFLVRLPGQQSPVEIGEEFMTVHTRGLIRRILSEKAPVNLDSFRRLYRAEVNSGLQSTNLPNN